MKTLMYALHNPLCWLEISTDRRLSLKWGDHDARIIDPESREQASNASLLLLNPIFHRRYWAAYNAAAEES